ncbi:MAG: CpsB/CapC family capsule biosynthesis tyrosine phosphatase [Bacteroidota bacterium]
MFSFFEKKIFLVDHLHGLVDIHNHILPGIDDGAKSIEDSIELISGFTEFGINNFVCTPHIMSHYYPNTPKTIKTAFEALNKSLDKQGIKDVKIDYAAEHMIDENFETLLNKNLVLRLRKEYLLVEMSYLQPSLNFNDAIQNITSRSIYPILAHPERYGYFHNSFSVYESIKKMGVLFQLNLLSLTGYYGVEIQKTSLKLLKAGLIEFISSDVHNMNHIKRIKEIKIKPNTLNQILPVVENTILTFY